MESKTAYVRYLETQLRWKTRLLDEYAEAIHELCGELRAEHLMLIRKTQSISDMTEHAEGKESCTVCTVLKNARKIYHEHID